MARIISTLILSFSFLVTFAQPEVSLWRVHEGHETDFYHCGAAYYFIHDGEQKMSHWSIKNEGDKPLELSLPLSFADSSSDDIYIEAQPEEELLDPGEEAHFTIAYSGQLDGASAFLYVNSNATNSEECGLLLTSGLDPVCTCRCVGDLETPTVLAQAKHLKSSMANGVLDCPDDDMADGVPNGIAQLCVPDLLNGGLVGDGEDCVVPIFTDPCDCKNYMELDNGTILFPDVLTVEGLPGQYIYLTQNLISPGGFVDGDNMPILPSRFIGQLVDNGSGIGIVKFNFYRQSGQPVNILLNGLPFTSDACSIEDCPDTTIPTMGEWGLICLIVLFLIFGVVGIRQTTLAKA